MLICTFYAAVGDEITYRIALLLSRYRLSVKELVNALDLRQPHVSHKLAKLRKYGCVLHKRIGRSVFYEMQEPCRNIIVYGDALWRELRPEHQRRWNDDIERLKAYVDNIEERTLA
jgi:DNA-binding transcriptional ArsR family regulator